MPRVAPQVDHHADALAVGLVAHVGDAVDLLVARQLGDLLDQIGLVDLVGQLGDDDADLAALGLFGVGLGADDDAPASRAIGVADALAALDDAAGGEVRPTDDVRESSIVASGLSIR